MQHTVVEIAGELTNAPDDGFGAVLDRQYRVGQDLDSTFGSALSPIRTTANTNLGASDTGRGTFRPRG